MRFSARQHLSRIIMRWLLRVHKMNRGTQGIRTKLKRFLGRDVSNAVWKLLVKDRYVDEVEKGDASIEDLARRVADLEPLEQKPISSSSGGLTNRRHRRLNGRALRAQAIAVLFAEEARERDDVARFRKLI